MLPICKNFFFFHQLFLRCVLYDEELFSGTSLMKSYSSSWFPCIMEKQFLLTWHIPPKGKMTCIWVQVNFLYKT